VLLAGCAPRSSQTAVTPADRVRTLDETTAQRLLAVWQTRLCRSIAHAGGDDAVLSELRALRAKNVPRPARIRFGVLDVEAGGGRWDVQGVLVGRRKNGPFLRHVFVVGIVGHRAYLASEVRDLRVVVLSPVAGELVWETSAPDAAALERYRENYGAAVASGFPARDDDFRLRGAHTRVAVRETRSGADWTLELRTDLRDIRGMMVSDARRAARADGDACLPRPAGS
jgi:hypothetical protein